VHSFETLDVKENHVINQFTTKLVVDAPEHLNIFLTNNYYNLLPFITDFIISLSKIVDR
jgi:hypothetical protein